MTEARMSSETCEPPPITHAMIEAGVDALLDSGFDNEFLDVSPAQAVRQVLQAALDTARGRG